MKRKELKAIVMASLLGTGTVNAAPAWSARIARASDDADQIIAAAEMLNPDPLARKFYARVADERKQKAKQAKKQEEKQAKQKLGGKKRR